MHDAQKICDRIAKSISGTADASSHITRCYSVDASAYMIRPDIIVTPESIGDVATVIKIASSLRVPVTARGGGTGLVGGALNVGIILEMRKINGIDISHGKVTAGAGASRGALDCALGTVDATSGFPGAAALPPYASAIFAPNPSVGPFCTIGGMIGTNAAGSRSLKYGATIDNVRRVTMVDGTGKIITLPDDHVTGSKVLEIARSIDAGSFPKVSKNSSGYRLDAVTSIDDTHKAIVGSEGTLGVVVKAELRVIKRPGLKPATAVPSQQRPPRRLYMLEYRSDIDAASDCTRIIKCTPRPAAAEFADSVILENMEYGFKKDTTCLLFVEYDDACSAGSSAYPEDASMPRAAEMATSITCVTDEREISRLWRHRDASLYYSIMAVDKESEELVPHVIEDASVPVESLPVLFSVLQNINKMYDTRTITYGHAGNGNIHVRLISKKGGMGNLQKIAADYFKSITAAGGSITGEHGDGLARSEFVSMQYGPHNIRQFARLKDMFDPLHIMNLGKILTNKPGLLMQNLWDTT